MKKTKTEYVCTNCGFVSPKWMGKCTECNEWNSFVEEMADRAKSMSMAGSRMDGSTAPAQAVRIRDVSVDEDVRLKTGLGEFDRVMGGGIVEGSLTLVGGDPGVGKSTLLLQISNLTSSVGKTVLYVSAEESLKQIKIRAERLGVIQENVFLLCETNMDLITSQIEKVKPDILIIDSIQTVFMPGIESSPGSVSQVREVTSLLMRIAKQNGIATFIIGHVTKTGNIAGPKVLEHIVDTVLYFEGERYSIYRVIRAVKNRFGSTNEIGIFEMFEGGLREVSNPSELFLTNRGKNVSGSVTCAVMEGTRPVLVEIQALISPSSFSSPRRMSSGVDYNKTSMLMAVLEKRTGMQLAGYDGYVNVVGGLEIDEPAVDLGIVVAVSSSFRNVHVDSDVVVMGEVGLTGEIRPVSNIQSRISEAAKLGFKTAIVPKDSLGGLQKTKGIKVIGVSTLDNLFEILF